jgi:hypothetical protein
LPKDLHLTLTKDGVLSLIRLNRGEESSEILESLEIGLIADRKEECRSLRVSFDNNTVAVCISRIPGFNKEKISRVALFELDLDQLKLEQKDTVDMIDDNLGAFSSLVFLQAEEQGPKKLVAFSKDFLSTMFTLYVDGFKVVKIDREDECGLNKPYTVNQTSYSEAFGIDQNSKLYYLRL